MSNRPEKHFFIQADLPWDISQVSGGRLPVKYWNYPDANYREWIIYWNSSPGGEIRCKGEKYPLKPANVVLIPPYTGFSTRSYQEFDHFFLHFTAPEPFDRVKRQIFTFPAGTLFPELVGKIGDTAGTPLQMLYIRLAALLVLSQLPRQAFLADAGEVMDVRIKHAVNILEQDLGRKTDNRKLARKVGMSLNSFYTLFAEETGSSPKHYFLSLKMEQARKLLLHSRRTIQEIAQDTGFADRYCFSKAFKKFYDFSPAEYRKRHAMEK